MKESRVSPIIRPLLLLSVGGITVGVAFVSGIVETFFPGYGARFGATVTGTLSQVPDAWVDLFETMFVAYALAKTGERGVKAYTDAKYDGGAQ